VAGVDGVSEHPVSREDALAAAQYERDRTLEAIHRLETALSTAAETDRWLEEVRDDLGSLESAMVEEQRELNRPDALLAMIAEHNPRRFGPRIRSLREQYDDLIRQISSLRAQIHESEHGADDIRLRAGAIIRSLHHCRGRQADLVYDALREDLAGRRDG
jgi:hypothetical protein